MLGWKFKMIAQLHESQPDQIPWGQKPQPLIVTLGIAIAMKQLLPNIVEREMLNLAAKISDTNDVERDGIKLRCHYADNSTERRLALNREKDWDNIDRIVSDLRPGDTFIDIGANCGIYALHAAGKVGRDGRVIAVEPMAEMRRRLAFNAEANGFQNIEIIESAIGDTSGVLTLYLNERKRGSTSAAWRKKSVPVKTPMTTLPALVGSLGITKIDALKIDIEGHEDRALLPMIRTLSSEFWPRRILLEVSHADRWAEPCVKLLAGAGYRQTWSSGRDVLLEI
jgi:FkbM family methyltransferase